MWFIKLLQANHRTMSLFNKERKDFFFYLFFFLFFYFFLFFFIFYSGLALSDLFLWFIEV